MKEDFLHYLWRFSLFNQEDLKADGQSLKILDAGFLNTNEGPDFLNARIRIGETIWAGNIEIHVNASDWLIHKHSKLYDTIILHVVLNNDTNIVRKNGEVIPVLELYDKIDYKLYDRYKSFIESKSRIPCNSFILDIEKIKLNIWLHALAIERLERKSTDVISIFNDVNCNWEETLFRIILRYFGSSLNSSAFEMLSKTITYNLLKRNSDSLFQLEALLFGQAGLLEDVFVDEYPQALQQEYTHLRKKYSLTPIDSSLWNFFRIRPVAFPTIRIALFASLLHSTNSLFSKIIELDDIQSIKELLIVNASTYWDTHYQFDSQSKYSIKHLGDLMIESIIINAIVPLLFVYGKEMNDERFIDKAIFLLEQIKPENNYIIRKWMFVGIKGKNAFETQALLQLQKYYCDKKACLQCVVGNFILSSPKN